jgi:hypothetical protein
MFKVCRNSGFKRLVVGVIGSSGETIGEVVGKPPPSRQSHWLHPGRQLGSNSQQRPANQA